MVADGSNSDGRSIAGWSRITLEDDEHCVVAVQCVLSDSTRAGRRAAYLGFWFWFTPVQDLNVKEPKQSSHQNRACTQDVVGSTCRTISVRMSGPCKLPAPRASFMSTCPLSTCAFSRYFYPGAVEALRLQESFGGRQSHNVTPVSQCPSGSSIECRAYCVGPVKPHEGCLNNLPIDTLVCQLASTALYKPRDDSDGDPNNNVSICDSTCIGSTEQCSLWSLSLVDQSVLRVMRARA